MASTISFLSLGLVFTLFASPVFCQLDRVALWAGDRIVGAWQGAGDMWRAYEDMREANYIGADKYFHARGNYEAAQRGPGGKWAAEVISNARELWQSEVSGRGAEDTEADQVANNWGREGGDPNVFRPRGLPDEF